MSAESFCVPSWFIFECNLSVLKSPEKLSAVVGEWTECYKCASSDLMRSHMRGWRSLVRYPPNAALGLQGVSPAPLPCGVTSPHCWHPLGMLRLSRLDSALAGTRSSGFGRSEEQLLHSFQMKTALAVILKDGDIHEEARSTYCAFVDGKSVEALIFNFVERLWTASTLFCFIEIVSRCPRWHFL